MAADYSEVVPPSILTVEHSHRPVLYLPDGRALVRQAGFHVGITMSKGKSGGKVDKLTKGDKYDKPGKSGKKGC